MIYEFMTCLRDTVCATLEADALAFPNRGYADYCECNGQPCCNSEVAWCEPAIECCGVSVWPGTWSFEPGGPAGSCHTITSVPFNIRYQACRPLAEEANLVVVRTDQREDFARFMTEVAEIIVCELTSSFCNNFGPCYFDPNNPGVRLTTNTYSLNSVTCNIDSVLISLTAKFSC